MNCTANAGNSFHIYGSPGDYFLKFTQFFHINSF